MEEDSFFGFDISLPVEDNGRKLEEEGEDVYDALNDETFGSAINGDWEKSHEQLVKLDNHNGVKIPSSSVIVEDNFDEFDDANSDLELSLSRVRLDDVDIGTDDNECRVQLDPTVWANLPTITPVKTIDINSIPPPPPLSNVQPTVFSNSNPETFIRQHFPNPFEIVPITTSNKHLPQLPNNLVMHDHLQLQNEQMIRQQLQNNQVIHDHQLQSNQLMQNHQLQQNQIIQDHQQSQNNQVNQQHLQNNPLMHQQQPPVHLNQQPPLGHHFPPIPQNEQQPLGHHFPPIQQNEQQPLGHHYQPIQQNEQPNNFFALAHSPGINKNPQLPAKISTLEDIERNIRNQQQLTQQQMKVISPQSKTPIPFNQNQQQTVNLHFNQHSPQNVSMQFNQHNNQSPSLPFNPQPLQPIQAQLHQQHQLNGNFFGNRNGPIPPGFHQGRNNYNLPIHPLNIIHPQPQTSNSPLPTRAPPGFNNLPLIPGNPPNFPRQIQNLPIALNNFAMHPNFNAMRQVGPSLCPQRMPPHPSLIIQGQPQLIPPQNLNQFNQRLLQEIQQNHPMLPNRAILTHLAQNQMHNNQQYPMMNPQQQRLHQEMYTNKNNINMTNNNNNNNITNNNNNNNTNNSNTNNNNNNNNNNNTNTNNGKQNPRSNNSFIKEYDEYANLMSTRDKHWLIGIQLSQLNTDTPFIDDYYYTIYKGRKAKLIGDSGQSRTHKDNQLNHPFSQPKGHAQLVLIQMGNKNGAQRNGQNNRERKNSETQSNNQKDQQHLNQQQQIQQQIQQQQQHRHTPLQFENSLGKLQYGSVTAPRKIIDMEIMGNEGSQLNKEISTQRSARYILLHIETLYRLVLKLEDLENPAAISTSIALKEKKEKEKQLALEQKQVNELGGGDGIEDPEVIEDSEVVDKYAAYELESKEALLAKIVPCLNLEKVISMMNVRKGKTLIRRLLPHIEDNEIRWTIWMGVFSSLPTVLRKDKEDKEGLLYLLHPILQKQIKKANLEKVVKYCSILPLSDKKLNIFFSNKFCISSLVTLILRAEEIYNKYNPDDDAHKKKWRVFLQNLATTLNEASETHIVSASIESTSLKPMISHLIRFKDLNLDSLEALFSQATRVNFKRRN